MPEPQKAEDLYGVDPSEFTAARNVLVKRLKTEGKVEEAVGVAKLRRPSPTVWVLNQIARQQPELIALVLASGRRLREATGLALQGDRSGLPDARAAEGEAIDSVLEEAAQKLGAAGMSAGDEPIRRMTETLRSATVDEAVAALLVRGVIDSDKESVGFDFSPILSTAESAMGPIGSSSTTQTAATRRRDREARQRLTTAIEQLRKKAHAAHSVADEASTTAVRLARRAAEVDAELAKAEQQLERLGP